VAQSDQRTATEVRDKEADLAGTDRLRQRGGEHIDRRHGRSGLDRREQRIDVQRRSPAHIHLAKPKRPRACNAMASPRGVRGTRFAPKTVETPPRTGSTAELL